jgi:hypothetical protein
MAQQLRPSTEAVTGLDRQRGGGGIRWRQLINQLQHIAMQTCLQAGRDQWQTGRLPRPLSRLLQADQGQVTQRAVELLGVAFNRCSIVPGQQLLVWGGVDLQIGQSCKHASSQDLALQIRQRRFKS